MRAEFKTVLVALSAALMTSPTLPANAASETVVHSFKGHGSAFPMDRLLLRSGSLYGTTSGQTAGSGDVFKLKPSGGTWKMTTIFKFGENVGSPYAGLIKDSTGAFYGTTYNGGATGFGTVYKLYKTGGAWKATDLHDFGSGADGADPSCDLIMDKSGDLYGTTIYGGAYGLGTVFELVKSGSTWTENVLWSFEGESNRDGANPSAGLYMDKSGDLYGTTAFGGDYGYGTVFEMVPSGGGWTMSELHAFGGANDGVHPYGVLVPDSKGGVYGTTVKGGASGYGTVFELSISGGVLTYAVIYSFAGGSDAEFPEAGLLRDTKHVLYGTTTGGGTYGKGTVFKLSRSAGVWTDKVLHSFSGGSSDGGSPEAAVIEDSAGKLYGTTIYGGKDGGGTVYEIVP